MNLASKLGVAALAAALTAGLTVPASSASQVPVGREAAHKPTLKADASSVVAGKKLVLSGKVRPADKGGAVTLQKRIGESKKWSKEARLKLSQKGRFTYTDKPKTPGVRHYRVVVPKAGRSKPVKVTVLRWQSLTDLPFRAYESTQIDGSGASIGGKVYAPAVEATRHGVQGTADWNIPSVCTTLRVRLGNGDQTDLGAFANISLDGGPGEFAYAHSYGPTQSEVKTFDVSDVFRLTFTWTSTVTGGPEPAAGAEPVLVQPELLCAS